MTAANTTPQSRRDPCASPQSPPTFPSYLVTPSELNSALQLQSQTLSSASDSSPRIKPLCGTWAREGAKLSGRDEFRAGRIHGAQFFDLDTVQDVHSAYPQMLPSPEVFAAAMSSLGIRRDDTVVVYDSADAGIYSAPRVGWMLRIFGHPRVHVLNNYKLWVEEGFPVDSGAPEDPEPALYPVPDVKRAKVVQFEEMQKLSLAETACQSRDGYILDARSFGRWSGREPEPTPGKPRLSFRIY
jgi:thiosulfate/3-mercaptopyruvate sulfurtransferase